MNDLYFLDLPEREYVKTLSRGADLHKRAERGIWQDLAEDLPDGHVRLVWELDGPSTGLPSLIIAERPVLFSLLSRMIAIPQGLSPFTSVVKTWDTGDLKSMGIPRFAKLDDLIAYGFVGLIIGELVHSGVKEQDFRRLGLEAARRTLASVCAETLTQGYGASSLETIAGRWSEIGRLTGSTRTSNPDISLLAAFLSSMRGSYISGITTEDLVREIQAFSQMRKSRQAELMPTDSIVEHVFLLSKNRSREARVSFIEAALAEFQGRDGFVLEKGFLISLIEPGSFDFFDFVSRYDDSKGSVAIAYAMCAGLLGGNSTLTKFRGFGMNLYANGLFSASNVSADISIAELVIRYDAIRENIIDFRTNSPSSIRVELFPGVTADFANTTRRKSTRKQDQEEQAEFDVRRERLMYARRALDAASAALGEVTEIEDKIKTSALRR